MKTRAAKRRRIAEGRQTDGGFCGEKKGSVIGVPRNTASMNSSVAFSTLDRDCLSNVFSFLSTISLRQCAATCKHFNQASLRPTYYRTIVIDSVAEVLAAHGLPYAETDIFPFSPAYIKSPMYTTNPNIVALHDAQRDAAAPRFRLSLDRVRAFLCRHRSHIRRVICHIASDVDGNPLADILGGIYLLDSEMCSRVVEISLENDRSHLCCDESYNPKDCEKFETCDVTLRPTAFSTQDNVVLLVETSPFGSHWKKIRTSNNNMFARVCEVLRITQEVAQSRPKMAGSTDELELTVKQALHDELSVVLEFDERIMFHLEYMFEELLDHFSRDDNHHAAMIPTSVLELETFFKTRCPGLWRWIKFGGDKEGMCMTVCSEQIEYWVSFALIELPLGDHDENFDWDDSDVEIDGYYARPFLEDSLSIPIALPGPDNQNIGWGSMSLLLDRKNSR